MNQTFSAMADDVDTALQEYRDAEAAVAEAKQHLGYVETDLANARTKLEKAKTDMFEAHPELAPAAPAQQDSWVPPDTDPGGFTPVEVDDPDDVPDFRERA